MDQLPLISVIMPCYNADEYVSDAINSVLEQTYGNVELIIIDDGSTDKSLEICEKYQASQNNVRVEAQKNAGPYPARNLGLQVARGEFIAFLDADDYWSTDCLKELYDGIVQNEADMAYCGWQNIGEGGPGSTEPYIPPEYEKWDIVKSFLKSCPWPIHAALVKRDIIERLNGFSERYFTSLDFDLWLRLTEVTQNIVRIPKVMAFYRWHGSGQISSVKSRQVLDAWNVRRDYVKKNPGLVAHIPKKEMKLLINESLLKNAYIAYWKRDFISSRILFRKAFVSGCWGVGDLKYILIAFFPLGIVKALVRGN